MATFSSQLKKGNFTTLTSDIFVVESPKAQPPLARNHEKRAGKGRHKPPFPIMDALDEVESQNLHVGPSQRS